MEQEMRERVQRCAKIGDVTRNGVVFDWWLASSAGAGFELFREPRHSDADIEEAKRHLHADRDVVGRIRVTVLDEDINAHLNPRYLAYCTAHYKTPERMDAMDQKRWPGGVMAGFILWSNAQLAEARKQHPEWFADSRLLDHKLYDEWLWRRSRDEQAQCGEAKCH